MPQAQILPFPQSPQQTQLPPSATPATPATSLPRLEAPPNERFLGYEPLVPGRAVINELYSPAGATGEERLALSKYYRQDEGVNLQDLGLAAQALERAGLNWRQAKSHEKILAASASLAGGTVN